MLAYPLCLPPPGQQPQKHDPAPVPGAGSDKQPIVAASVDANEVAYEGDGFHEFHEKELPNPEECSFVVAVAKEHAVHSTDVPSHFHERDAYKKLATEGLVELPPVAGVGLYYHQSSSQWHAKYGHNGEINSAPKWSLFLRSERKAILLCQVNMWTWYCTHVSSEKKDAKYLMVLSKKLAETHF
eukprot:Skav200170  [mRNA]  locus=scaffold1159:41719:42270:+ [translate_table: standard]